MTPENASLSTSFSLPPLKEPEPPASRLDVDRLRAVLDAKVRALHSLCMIQISGKATDADRANVKILVGQIMDLQA